MARFLQTWFGEVVYLKFGFTVFYSHQSMLNGLYTLRSLRKVFLCRQALSDYDAWKLGLEEAPFKSPTEWERSTRHLSCQTELQRLRLVASEKQAEEEEKEARARAEAEAEALADARAKAQEDARAAGLDGDALEAAVASVTVAQPDIPVDKDDSLKTEPTLTPGERVRCQSVDSAIALEEEEEEKKQQQAQAAEKAKMEKELEELEMKKSDIFESLRCVYVFRNTRYHRKADTPQDVICS